MNPMESFSSSSSSRSSSRSRSGKNSSISSRYLHEMGLIDDSSYSSSSSSSSIGDGDSSSRVEDCAEIRSLTCSLNDDVDSLYRQITPSRSKKTSSSSSSSSSSSISSLILSISSSSSSSSSSSRVLFDLNEKICNVVWKALVIASNSSSSSSSSSSMMMYNLQYLLDYTHSLLSSLLAVCEKLREYEIGCKVSSGVVDALVVE